MFYCTKYNLKAIIVQISVDLQTLRRAFSNQKAAILYIHYPDCSWPLTINSSIFCHEHCYTRGGSNEHNHSIDLPSHRHSIDHDHPKKHISIDDHDEWSVHVQPWLDYAGGVKLSYSNDWHDGIRYLQKYYGTSGYYDYPRNRTSNANHLPKYVGLLKLCRIK